MRHQLTSAKIYNYAHFMIDDEIKSCTFNYHLTHNLEKRVFLRIFAVEKEALNSYCIQLLKL